MVWNTAGRSWGLLEYIQVCHSSYNTDADGGRPFCSFVSSNIFWIVITLLSCKHHFSVVACWGGADFNPVVLWSFMFLCCKKSLKYIFLKMSEENLPVNLLWVWKTCLFCFFIIKFKVLGNRKEGSHKMLILKDYSKSNLWVVISQKKGNFSRIKTFFGCV